MGRRAALLGFLAIQVVSVALWVSALMPFLTGGHTIVESAQQIWSGGGYSELDSSFRTGRDVVIAPALDPFGTLMYGALLMAGGALAALGAIFLWRRSRVWAAVGLAVVALLLGAAGNWFIASHWQGDTAFPPGYLNTDVLYSLQRAFNLQFFVGFALFALSTVLVVAGVATRQRPLGFQIVAVNWVVIAAVNIAAWLFLYVLPHKPVLG